MTFNKSVNVVITQYGSTVYIGIAMVYPQLHLQYIYIQHRFFGQGNIIGVSKSSLITLQPDGGLLL